MPTMTAGRAIVEVLKAEGVKFVFGVPGGHTLAIYDALYDTPEIRHVLMRHEQAVASMASAYTQLTGEPGLCLVTAGPGATNLVSGITEAYVGALPIIVLSGRGSTATTYKGDSQEMPTEKIFAPITKWAVRVDRADLVVDVLRQAFTIARSGRPGPVYVDLPRDILPQKVEFDRYFPVGPAQKIQADPQRIQAAVEALLKAKRPIVVTGGGSVASGAFDEIRELVESLGIPLLTSLAGRGSLSDDHPMAVGGLGCHRNDLSKRELNEADFVLSLGCRFESMENNWRPGFVPSPTAFFVQVDVDPAELGRSIVPNLGIVGDVKLVVQEMLRLIRQSGRALTPGAYLELPRAREIAQKKHALEREAEEFLTSKQNPINPVRAVMAIRRAFPRETTVSIDVGVLAQQIGGASPYFKFYGPRSTIVCSSFYGMGFASAALPAAKLVYPDRPAVGLVGDGSFQMVMNVMPAAVEEHLPVTWCILNDKALGSILDIQDGIFKRRRIATEFTFQPDFVKVAEGCGCYAERVEDPSQIDAALERAKDANSRGVPAVLDFIVARERTRATYEFYPHYADKL